MEKTENLKNKEKNGKKYYYYQFNMLLRLYIDNAVYEKKKNSKEYDGVRNTFRDDIYD